MKAQHLKRNTVTNSQIGAQGRSKSSATPPKNWRSRKMADTSSRSCAAIHSPAMRIHTQILIIWLSVTLVSCVSLFPIKSVEDLLECYSYVPKDSEIAGEYKQGGGFGGETLRLFPDKSFNLHLYSDDIIIGDTAKIYRGKYQLQNDTIHFEFYGNPAFRSHYTPAKILKTDKGMFILNPQRLKLCFEKFYEPKDLITINKHFPELGNILMFKPQ